MSAALRAYADREASSRGETSDATTDLNSSGTAPLVGKTVVISGLLGRPDLNGLVGEAGVFNTEAGRYAVTVAGETVALRSTNLQVKRRAEVDFGPATKVRIKGLTAKPELNGCGCTIIEWNEEKERYSVRLDGSLKEMLLRGANLERDKREVWMPAMHDPATTKHIQQEFEAYAQQQMANANPFASMGLDEAMMEKINNPQPVEERWEG